MDTASSFHETAEILRDGFRFKDGILVRHQWRPFVDGSPRAYRTVYEGTQRTTRPYLGQEHQSDRMSIAEVKRLYVPP